MNGEVTLPPEQAILLGTAVSKFSGQVAEVLAMEVTRLRDYQKDRVQIIQGTPGFAEHIVADFDYSVFARKAV